ncbi:PREDICTED: mitotic apparatus protein p62 [Theobroma cacao]|uniref:Mitotic apparatus protein p62 n=1 Tax=Theobroma cacao TaxID=3641 RepID=A0AB32V0N5_THECC|nr:PREDICTED: mitotic apparatus protein p62 [Theobroma cacao]
MEIEGANGSKLALKYGFKTVFGRGSGFNTSDRTVSRHHVLLELGTPVDKKGETQKEPRVSFEVTGKNPVWVRSRKNGAIKVFKNSDKDELADGDWLCVSSRIPVWFVLKKSEENGKEEEGDLGSESGAEIVDIEDIDPVKEFGFLVMGHEFDQYPNESIRNIKNWDWFLEESGKDSEDDDEAGGERRRGRKGSKRRKGDNDDDWTGESEDDKDVNAKGRKVQRAVYSTRSKERDKSKKDSGGKNRSSVRKKSVSAGEGNGADEDDETLGGFIVEDDDAELEEESELDEEEEEDFDDEDEDNEDDE